MLLSSIRALRHIRSAVTANDTTPDCCTPIHHCIDFKPAKLVFLVSSSATSSYLNSSVSQYLPSCLLRSQVFGSHTFRVAAPTVFNSLPQDIRSHESISMFCRLSRTFHFHNDFNVHRLATSTRA